MNRPRWTASPLAGTAAVLAALALLAIPLHRLTSSTPATSRPAEPKPAPRPDHIPAVLVLKLLHAADSITVRTADGESLWQLAPAPAGESELDAQIPFPDRQTELTLEARFGTAETAAFLTVMPDGHDEQTRFLIGSGTASELLTYSWNRP